jgi:hypothetical protein
MILRCVHNTSSLLGKNMETLNFILEAKFNAVFFVFRHSVVWQLASCITDSNSPTLP